MNVKKIQIEAIKSLDKLVQYKVKQIDDKTTLFTDGYVAWIIPKPDIVINIDKFQEAKSDFEKFRFTDRFYRSKHMVRYNKSNLTIYQDVDGEKIYINEHLLSHFDIEKCTFTGNANEKALNVFEKEQWCGIIMGVRVPSAWEDSPYDD